MVTPEDPVEALSRALALLVAIEDHAERGRAAKRLLEAIPGLQTRVRETRGESARAMRATDMTWTAIGVELGVSRAQAKAIAEGRPPGRRNARLRAERTRDTEA